MNKTKAKEESKDQGLSLRIPSELKAEFLTQCEHYGIKWPELMREMIEASVDGRLVINVPRDQLRLITGLHNPSI